MDVTNLLACQTCGRPMRRKGDPSTPGVVRRMSSTTCQSCYDREYKARRATPTEATPCRWCGRDGKWQSRHCDACTKYERDKIPPPTDQDAFTGRWVLDPVRKVLVPA